MGREQWIDEIISSLDFNGYSYKDCGGSIILPISHSDIEEIWINDTRMGISLYKIISPAKYINRGYLPMFVGTLSKGYNTPDDIILELRILFTEGKNVKQEVCNEYYKIAYDKDYEYELDPLWQNCHIF